eukprot:TRINITY_DN21742_c0_g1_i1.p1 TRINITY_DN21742_c0_g1~~TRINITY_DN21742_c0_g1_i1.p1  ORF type:complete len:1794 (+),score=431.85 TRINITY_DN21742_c0_g1_i1:110-5491(+)
MPVRATSAAHAASSHGTGVGGASVSLAGRVRSASPSRRALAIDMRHIASLLRDPQHAAPAQAAPMPMNGPGDASANTSPAEAADEKWRSICNSPHTAWEPGDRGAAPVRLARSPAAGPRPNSGIQQHQFTALAEKVNVVIAGLQRQCDADRRRLQQLERKVDARLEERTRDNEGRQNLAEIQGSVHGLVEETQALTRRIEGLDERLWARTSGSELAKQRNRELEQSVQAMDQQSRLAAAAIEETQKRQAAKLRRAEHELQELSRRLAKTDEEMRSRPSQQRDSHLEARVVALEQHQENLEHELRGTQDQLDECHQGVHDLHANVGVRDDQHEEGNLTVEDAIQTCERGISSLEKKIVSQVEELASSLASIRVKVDGQLQRVGTLAERMETAHAPAIDSLRAELMQSRQQDRRELEGELVVLRSKLQEALDGHDESLGEHREQLRQTRAEIAAISLRPQDSPQLRSAHERLDRHEQEVLDIRQCLEQLPPPLPHGGTSRDAENGDRLEEDEEGKLSPGELGDLHRRLEWLEGQAAANAASDESDHAQEIGTLRQALDGHSDRHAKLCSEVSRLTQRSSTGDAAYTSLQQQVQHIQTALERSDDSGSERRVAEVAAQIGAVSQQVAKLDARLLEVEGGMEYARESGEAVGSVGQGRTGDGHASYQSEHVPGGGGLDAAGLQEKLEAIAETLEFVNDLEMRVVDLERRSGTGELGDGDSSTQGIPESPTRNSEVSKTLRADVGQLRDSMSSLDLQVKAITEDLAKKDSCERDLEKGLRAEINCIKGLADTVAAMNDKVNKAHDAKDIRADLKELREKLAEQERQLSHSHEDKPSSPSAQFKRDDMEEVRKRLDELHQKFQATADKPGGVDVEHRQVAESASAAAKKAEAEALKALADSAAAHTKAAALEEKHAKFAEQLRDLESRHRESKGTDPSFDDLEVRVKSLIDDVMSERDDDQSLAEVRKELRMVALSLEEVVKDVGRQKEESEGTQTSLDAMSERVAQEVLSTGKEIASLTVSVAEVKTLAQRMDRVETEVSSIGKEIAPLTVIIAEVKTLAKRTDQLETEQKATATLAEHVAEMKSFGQRIDHLDTKHSELAERALKLGTEGKGGGSASDKAAFEAMSTSLSEMQARVNKLTIEERPHPHSAKEEESRARVMERVEELTAKVTKELHGMAEQHRELVVAKVEVEELRKKVDGLDTRVDTVEKSGTKDAHSGSRSPGAGSADVEAVKHDMAKVKAEVHEFGDLTDGILSRVQAVEEMANTTKRDFESLLPRKTVGISPSGTQASPIMAITDRIEELSDQMSQLKQRVGTGSGSVGAGEGGRLPQGGEDNDDIGGERSLNFSLTEQTERMGGSFAPAGENSLDFSLTGSRGMSLSESAPVKKPTRTPQLEGMLEVPSDEDPNESSQGSVSLSGSQSASFSASASPAGADNHGVREKKEKKRSKRHVQLGGDGLTSPMSRLGDLPQLGSRRSPAASSGDMLDSLVGGVGSLGAGGRKNKAGGGGDAIDSLMLGKKKTGGEMGGDAFDTPLSGGGGANGGSGGSALGGRPRPSPLGFEEDRAGLASVKEEDGHDATDSRGSRRTRGLMEKTEPALSATVASSPAGSTSALEASFTSQTAHEMSVGADYSVEDSTELEDKCDHWEAVQLGPASHPASSRSGAGLASSKDLKSGDVSPASTPGHGKGLHAHELLAKKAQGKLSSGLLDHLGGALGLGSHAEAGSHGVSNVVSRAEARKQGGSPRSSSAGSPAAIRASGLTRKDDDEYGHESFDDDSVCESIDESVASGSATQEDV